MVRDLTRSSPLNLAGRAQHSFVLESRFQAEFTTIFCTGLRAIEYQMEFFSDTGYWLHGRQLYEKPVSRPSDPVTRREPRESLHSGTQTNQQQTNASGRRLRAAQSPKGHFPTKAGATIIGIMPIPLF